MMSHKNYRLMFALALFCHILAGSVAAQTPATQGGSKANTDPVYQQIRQKFKTIEDFNGHVATVNGVVLRRDAATFKFNSGEVYFLTPVDGRTFGAVFIGDGDMTLVPPTEAEKHSLSIFTDKPEFSEHFARLVMRFTDQTFEEIKKIPGVAMASGGGQAARARDAYREIETLMRKQVRTNLDLETLRDVTRDGAAGYFMAFPGGGRFDKLAFVLSPGGIADVEPEEVALYSFGDRSEEIWTAFHLATEYEGNATVKQHDRCAYDITHHEIDAAIRGARIIASDKITLQVLAGGLRMLQLDLDKNGRMDWFFNEWVYGTEIPAYRITHQIGSADGKTTLTVHVTQSGVSDGFRMLVPIYADFGKGWTRLGAAKMTGNGTIDIPNIPLPQSPKKVTLCALSDVLFTSLETGK